MTQTTRYQKGDLIGNRFYVFKIPPLGGFGEVYICADVLTDNHPWVLKTLKPEYFKDTRLPTLLKNEVDVWIGLGKHLNIVQCNFLSIIDNVPFIFMEWVDGDKQKGNTLRSWLHHARGPLDLRLALDITIDVCRGMSYACQQQAGFVHRDLKPENILLLENGTAKVTDFGLAKIVENIKPIEPGGANPTQQSSVAGTLFYMAPEQFHRGQPLSCRADIYAVGSILYEMLTGQFLFQVSASPFTTNSWQSNHYPAQLEQLISRCLQKDAAQRFATWEELLGELTICYEQLFATSPKSPPTATQLTAWEYYTHGVTHVAIEQYEKALADYEQVLLIDPNHVATYANRGRVYDTLKRYDEALADFEHALQLDPTYNVTYSNRGNTFFTLQRYEEALADYSESVRLNPHDATAYNNRGNTYFTLKRYNEAFADFEQAIQLDPNDAKAYYNRGLVHATLQRPHEALTDYGQSLRLDPTYPTAYYNRGNVYRTLQLYNDALANYNEALRLDPNYSTVYNNRGTVYYALQQYDKALIDYQIAIHFEPNSVSAYNNIGNLYQALQHYGEALASFEQALAINPNDASAYNNRANIYDALQRYEEALADYGQAIRLDPSYMEAYYNRALTYKTLKQYQSALADFKRTIQLNPSHDDAYYQAGYIYSVLKQDDEALDNFEEAIALNPTHAAAHFNIGILYYNHYKLAESLPYFEKAVTLANGELKQLALNYEHKIRHYLKNKRWWQFWK